MKDSSSNLAPNRRNLEVVENGKVDVSSLMATIRARIKSDVDANRDREKPIKPQRTEASPRVAGELLHSEELRYLNQHWAYNVPNLNITTHRQNFLGKVIVKVKRKLRSFVWNAIFKDYLQAERDYHSNLVRFLNELSRYMDARDAGTFWELITKIDYEATKTRERLERVNDDATASLRSVQQELVGHLNAVLGDVQRNLEKLNTTEAEQQEKLQVLDNVAHGLEGMVAKLSKGVQISNGTAAPVTTPALGPDGFSYLMLENRFRGSEGEISRRLEIYPPIFVGTSAPVLEIGCGRGELQGLFKRHGVPSYGIDMDPAMAEIAAAKGLDARVGDGIKHLQGLPDKSLGGLIAIQVVEHLPRQVLEELLRLCAAKVVSGGKVIFETINPRSLLALSSNYFRDPTHVWPLHPDTLSYQMELAGIAVDQVRKLSPVPEEAKLREIPIAHYMTPRWVHTVETLNRNFKQLNDLIYGDQDYCVVGVVRAERQL